MAEHPVQFKQVGVKKLKELKSKIDNRTITREEYKVYTWNKKFAAKRDKGVKAFGNKKKQEYLMVKLQQEIGQKSKHKIF